MSRSLQSGTIPRSCKGGLSLFIWLALLPFLLKASTAAQTGAPLENTQATSNTVVSATVPRMIRISSMLHDDSGRAMSGVVNVKLSLYKDPSGGVALWQEIQNVTADASGRYSVLLGATAADGVPLQMFSSGEARWLGVQPEGQRELPRIVFLSVAYALKAADAETLGGKPLSAFVLSENQPQPTQKLADGPNVQSSDSINSLPPLSPCTAITSDGGATASQIAKFTTPCNVENSAIFESSGQVGIGNSAPTSTLDVSGGTTIRGELLLPAAGQATTSQGVNSNPVDLNAQAFNAVLGRGADYIFRWQAEPTGNNTSNTGATLNLLYGVPSSMLETGLSLNRSGVLTFAPGQTFPGSGTITGVTAGSGLTGGGTSGSVTLGLLNTCALGQVLSWNGTAWACSAAGSGTITGVTAGSGLSGGGTAGKVTLGLLSTCSKSQVLSWNGSAWACSATGTGTITGLTAGSGLSGGGVSGNVTMSLLKTCNTGQTLSWNGTSWTCSNSGTGTITGVTAGSGLSGGGTGGNVSLSLTSTCGTGQVLAWSGTAWSCSSISNTSGATNGVAYFSSPSTVTSTVAPTNGQLLIGSTGKTPALATLTAGSNISIANSAGQITISSTGNSATLPYFATAGGSVAASRIGALPNSNRLWGILLPYNVTTTQITYAIAIVDNTANNYDIGIFSSSGSLLVDLGPIPGSTFASTTGFITKTWVQGPKALPAGKYYLALTTNCAAACAQLEAVPSFISFAPAVSGGATTGGALPSSITAPADTWKSSIQPTVVIH